MLSFRWVALAALLCLAAPAVRAQPGGLPAPLGPSLSCADFTKNADGTWSVTHKATLASNGASGTVWPTTHLAPGLCIAGVNVGLIVSQQCGGPTGPQPDPCTGGMQPGRQPPPPPPNNPPPNNPPPPPEQPAQAGQLPAPLGPQLSCADFVRNSDGTWSIRQRADFHGANGAIGTIWPTTHLAPGVCIAGVNVGGIVSQACGGPDVPPVPCPGTTEQKPAPTPGPTPPGPVPPGTGPSSPPGPGPIAPPPPGSSPSGPSSPSSPSGPGPIAPPLGPNLTCADFVHYDDGTWSVRHAATVSYDGVWVTLWPTTRFAPGVVIAGKDFGALLQQACGATPPVPAPPNAPANGPPGPSSPNSPTLPPGCPTIPPPTPPPGSRPRLAPVRSRRRSRRCRKPATARGTTA
jgi:hypothetical protein